MVTVVTQYVSADLPSLHAPIILRTDRIVLVVRGFLDQWELVVVVDELVFLDTQMSM